MAADSDLKGPSSSVATMRPLAFLTQYQPPYLMGSPSRRREFQTFVVCRPAKNISTPAFSTAVMIEFGSLIAAPQIHAPKLLNDSGNHCQSGINYETLANWQLLLTGVSPCATVQR
jgi:hypothetical protein